LAPTEPIRTDILGVIARPATADEGGQGLHVRSTVPGSIAALLGIQGGDVLLEVNGRALSAIDDVTTALAERGENGQVAATWRDADGRRRTGTWHP
jgi:S1-C subfamily serine protease